MEPFRQSIKKTLLIGVLTAALVFFTPMLWGATSSAHAASFFDGGLSKEETITLLDRQIIDLEIVSRFVERIDLARLYVIKTSVQNARDNVNERGLGHMQSIRAFQNLIIQYRFSQAFFSDIRTAKSSSQIDELLEGAVRVAKEFGFDDSPYTQITANSFRQIQKLLKQLEELPVDAELKVALHAQWAPVASAIALAEQGDRPKAFAAAGPIVVEIRKLYPQFDHILASDVAFKVVLELQGLIEFYSDFAQMD